MSDYERYEPMTRGEKKEVGAEPHPDYFPGPSEHAEDIMSAANAFATVVSLIDRADWAQARSFAAHYERHFDTQLLNLYPSRHKEEGR